MRIILHIGMPKAGSTALQAAFVAARGPLRKRGILYPKGAFNHNFMVAGVAPADRIGRLFVQQYGGDAEAVTSDFSDFWGGIVGAIGRHKPSVVVLSAESLFNSIGRAGPEALRALLEPLGAQTEAVCYVRRPSDYYLSMAQQQLKASSVIRPVGAVAYRRPIEAAAGAADAIHVVRYERSLFSGGDIVADFAARFLPEAAGELRSVEDPKVKASMSAEAMDIVQAYRRNRHPDDNDRFTRDTGVLMRRLAEGEAALGGQRRPELLPEVRDLIDRSSVDLLWLRDAHGIVFDGIDYAAIAPAPGFRPKAVAEICRVDPERRAMLAAIADASPPATEDGERRKFRAAHTRRDRS